MAPNDAMFEKISTLGAKDVRDVYDTVYGRYQEQAPAVRQAPSAPAQPQPFSSIRKGR